MTIWTADIYSTSSRDRRTTPANTDRFQDSGGAARVFKNANDNFFFFFIGRQRPNFLETTTYGTVDVPVRSLAATSKRVTSGLRVLRAGIIRVTTVDVVTLCRRTSRRITRTGAETRPARQTVCTSWLAAVDVERVIGEDRDRNNNGRNNNNNNNNDDDNNNNDIIIIIIIMWREAGVVLLL